MRTITALVLPTDGPVVELRVGSLEALQDAVGGYIESVAIPESIDPLGTVSAYINEDGKRLALPPNGRATRLLAPSLFPNDWIAGDVVFCGYDPDTGDEADLPEPFALIVRSAA